jgi:type II secretory pathway component GspD/PulD (secretin)
MASVAGLAGCTATSSRPEALHKETVLQAPAASAQQETFVLRQITPEQATSLLEKVGVGKVTSLPADANGVTRLVVTGSGHQIEAARVVLGLADVNEVRQVSPPPQGQPAEPNKISRAVPEATARDQLVTPATAPAAAVSVAADAGQSPIASGQAEREGQPPVASTEPDAAAHDSGPAHPPLRGTLRPGQRPLKAASATAASPVTVPDGDQMLELALPEKMDLAQLLELAGTYLNLDYLYDPEKVKGQTVTLKLHGKLQGKVRVKDLYSLLETVLKFKGLAMTRQGGNLVSIVPAADALQADPGLVDPNGSPLSAGDVVVTRIFELEYADTASVTNLLQNMKQAVAVSAIEDSQTLFVTCYSQCMDRIERLVSLIDRPGRPREFRFRQLRFTMARTLAEKVRTLAVELQSVPIVVAAADKATTVGPSSSKPAGPSRAGRSTSGQAVYLDTDDRTNRILMIGFEEELATVEDLIDMLDVAQQDLRRLQVYAIRHIEAEDAVRKLEELEVIGKTGASARRSGRITAPGSQGAAAGSPSGPIEAAATEEPLVVILEATHSLLINATSEQHSRIVKVLTYIDAVQQDQRTLAVYEIRYIDAARVVEKLQQMEVIGGTASAQPVARRYSKITPSPLASPGQSPATEAAASVASVPGGAGGITDCQVVVLEQNNSLLVKATTSQHQQIQSIIQLVDVQTPQQAIPYEIYFLENQSPAKLAEVLNKIIQETVLNKEGKVEKVVSRMEDQIMIVPDEATFSLIVYANKKNQEWISTLVRKLDRRRPQVLIDVTLVEIRKTDEFTYDLTTAGSTPQPVQSADLGGASATFTEPSYSFQVKAGALSGFYGDTHINALLSAMARKNYGRVLAKPKVLVNDNEKGTIKTTETTYVTKKSSIPVTSGTAGQQNSLIETAVDYQGYDAGVALEITPHIGEKDLLRLEITTNRSDFGTISGDKPPDKASSDLSTVVTVPDQSTIILGGMLKLNQTKGGKKVPILGDLPLVGLLFRGVSNTDIQSKLYVFVRAEILRPAELAGAASKDLERISELNRSSFEKHEQEFQDYQTVPGAKPEPTPPAKVLQAR